MLLPTVHGRRLCTEAGRLRCACSVVSELKQSTRRLTPCRGCTVCSLRFSSSWVARAGARGSGKQRALCSPSGLGSEARTRRRAQHMQRSRHAQASAHTAETATPQHKHTRHPQECYCSPLLERHDDFLHAQQDVVPGKLDKDLLFAEQRPLRDPVCEFCMKVCLAGLFECFRM